MIRAGGATIIVSRKSTDLTGLNTVNYVTSDHLGSSAAVTDSAGGILVNSSFDAFGKRRGANWSGSPSAGDWTAIAGTTRRGFTEHSMLDNLNLTHMNGRVYDPVLGRFLSADPHITDPTFTQNFNRLSYVENNPLTYIDPSGFWIRAPKPPPAPTPDPTPGSTPPRWSDRPAGPSPNAPSDPTDRAGSGEIPDMPPNDPPLPLPPADDLPTIEVKGKRVKPRRLTDCEKQTLAPYIPQIDLDRARLYDGHVPFYLPESRFRGITRGHRIYIQQGGYDSMTADGLATLGHELVHVGQYRGGMTWVSYVLSSMRGYEHGNRYEAPAYAVSEQIESDLTENGFSGCEKPGTTRP